MRMSLCLDVGVSATLALCFAAQAQETCGSATPIGVGTTAFVAGATTNDNPGASCTPTSTNDVFFTFTPASSGNYSFETCNTAPGFFDTVLSVYSGACGATTQLGCADDSGCGTNGWSSRIINLALTGGTTYIVRIAAYDAGSLGDGNGVITIAGGAAPPANDLCVNAQVVGTRPRI